MTRLTENFSLEELTHTEQRALDNACPVALIPELLKTAVMLEAIKRAMSIKMGVPIPIFVTSGYRSQAVNAAVGGSPKSDHLLALAADFKAPAFGAPFEVATFLASRMDALGIGQVIHEFGRWVHVSRKPPEKSVNRIITISGLGTQVGIQTVA